MVKTHTKFNAPLKQNRADDLFSTFKQYGYGMFPQQRAIYRQLCDRVIGKTVLEAGCGNGLGSGMLARPAAYFMATDKEQENVTFAKELYPWLPCEVWDIEAVAWRGFHPQVVVCIECIEHVFNAEKAMKHLLRPATLEVWLSTPNGNAPGRERPPSNPHHVYEYSPEEIIGLVGAASVAGVGWRAIPRAWDDFRELPLDTKVDPLVYQIQRLR